MAQGEYTQRRGQLHNDFDRTTSRHIAPYRVQISRIRDASGAERQRLAPQPQASGRIFAKVVFQNGGRSVAMGSPLMNSRVDAFLPAVKSEYRS